MEQAFILILTLFSPPILVLVFLVLVLACFGKSLGIRRAYVQLLLRIFEWGGRRLERARKEQFEEYESQSPSSALKEDEGDEAEDGSKAEDSEGLPDRCSSFSTARIIERDATKKIVRIINEQEKAKGERFWTIIDDSLEFIKAGMESIIEDEVTSRFSAEELASWNLLTRTSGYGFQFMGLRLSCLWLFGCFLRYAILFPARLILLSIGLAFLVVCTAVIGYFPDGPEKRRLNRHVSLICYRVLSRACSAIITYHYPENRAESGGICVANHTSPIDVMILACDNCYALVGQSHGGLLGVIQRALNRASSHIWFERAQAKDRLHVLNKLREHVEDKDKLPILIFPEGTCINNTSVMMFKKGSFEVASTVYPVAIKYDPRFGDPFWNSSRQSVFAYLVMMMTSWAIVCEVWYLPPMSIKEGEDAIAFASRVKKSIAEAGGLVDLEWDGQLKRYPVPAKMIERAKSLYVKRLNFEADSNLEREP